MTITLPEFPEHSRQWKSPENQKFWSGVYSPDTAAQGVKAIPIASAKCAAGVMQSQTFGASCLRSHEDASFFFHSTS
ncbi:hypothetical protein TNCV_722001 [Trichonephila clavipes]|nr:hypothetical protein TNCV_722001 [Trichonephila clavipes]